MDKEIRGKLLKVAVIAAAGIVIWFAPCPEGLSAEAWMYFSAYIAAILGIMLHPFPSPGGDAGDSGRLRPADRPQDAFDWLRQPPPPGRCSRPL